MVSVRDRSAERFATGLPRHNLPDRVDDQADHSSRHDDPGGRVQLHLDEPVDRLLPKQAKRNERPDGEDCSMWPEGRAESRPAALHREASFDLHLSDELLGLLTRADKDLRTLWRPYNLSDEPEPVSAIIDRISRCWLKFETRQALGHR